VSVVVMNVYVVAASYCIISSRPVFFSCGGGGLA